MRHVAPDRVATTGTATGNDANNDSSKSRCDDDAAQPAWPATRVQQILQLTDSEHEALEKFQSAVVQSMKPVKSDCGASVDLPPPDRLGALVQTVWTVRDAGISVRGPLKNFYEFLDGDAEKQLCKPPAPDGTAGPKRRTQVPA